jgi:ribonuclease E
LKKLRHPRWLALSTVVAAMALISSVPAAALAVGEGFGTSATAGEGATESTGTTESPPPVEGSSPPASPGWVPQGDPAEDSGDAAATTRRGSSLGSGGSSNQSRPPTEQPAPSEQPAPTPVSSGSYEPEASSPSTGEEPASAPRAVPTVDPEPAAEPATVALGAANPVAKAASPQDSTRPAPPVEATPVANTSAPAAAGSGGLLWLTLIVGVLILLYAGARLLLGPVELDIFRSSPFRRTRRASPRG